jgi:uncharacterized protein YheU (UPF0270 family)
MIIPYDALSPEALDNLIKEYCLRDWGLNETESPWNERRAQVLTALKQKQLYIIYSEHEESAHIKAASELNMGP